MRIVINKLTGGVIQSPSNLNPVSTLAFKRGDTSRIEIQFAENGSPVELEDGATGKFMLKASGDYTGPAVVSDTTWALEGEGVTALYVFEPSFNTRPLNDELLDGTVGEDVADQAARYALTGKAVGYIVYQEDTGIYWTVIDVEELDNEDGWEQSAVRSSVTLIGEVEWLEDSARASSATFSAVVNSDVIRGDEGVPVTGAPVYPAPGIVVTQTGSPTVGNLAKFVSDVEIEDSGVAVSTDGTMAANSNLKLPTEAAIVTYVAARTAGLLDLKGSTDCSANPNYPAALKGDAYYVSVAGKIGGASGVVVAVGDVYFALADNAGGNEATVGTSWSALNYNLVAATELVAGVLPIADNAKVDAETDDASAMTVLKTLRLYNNQVALQNAVQSLAPSGTTQTIDFNNGGYVILDLTSATGHVTLTLQNPIPGKEYVFEVLDDSTTRNLIFPAGTTQSLVGGATWVSSGVSNIDLIGVRWNGTVYRIAGTSPDHG